MRVIGGEFRSRRLKTVEGWATRPTPDRLRETLFDVLAGRIEGAVFVDAYAGTGAVGIEALSRGAARCVFVESGRRAVEAIRENLRALGIEGRASVVAGKVGESRSIPLSRMSASSERTRNESMSGGATTITERSRCRGPSEVVASSERTSPFSAVGPFL